MKRKCAIFQFEGVHEEVIPSLVHSLNSLGFSPDVYISARCVNARGDIFEQMDALDCHVEYPVIEGRPAWNDLKEKARSGGYEFIVISTFQVESVAKWAMATGLPIYGLVHNAKIFLSCKDASEALTSGRAKILCLSPHVASFINQRLPLKHVDDVAVVQSVYWGESKSTAAARNDDARLVSIPGGVDFRTRGYNDLIKYLKENSPKTADGKILRFGILGGGVDRERLERLVEEEGLGAHFLFAPLGESKRVLYTDYIGILQQSDLLLPLAPLSFAPYREHKITSAIPTAIGFGLPVVLDRWTERVYQIHSIESDATIAATIEMAARVDDAEIRQAAAHMRSLREDVLIRNAKEFARLLRA